MFDFVRKKCTIEDTLVSVGLKCNLVRKNLPECENTAKLNLLMSLTLLPIQDFVSSKAYKLCFYPF